MPVNPEEFKRRDAASYDPVAESFHRWTSLVTSPLARDLLDLAPPRWEDKILDVGCGSGVVALEAARRIGKSGQVVGIDLSRGMLEVAERNSIATGVSDRAAFRQMDAEHLEFENSSFDTVLSLFAVLHLPHPAVAVAEMFRVVKPGGRVVIGIGSGMPLSVRYLPSAWQRVLEKISVARKKLLVAPFALDRFVAERLPQDADHEHAEGAHISHSLTHLLQTAGFRETKVVWKDYSHAIENAADFWEIQATLSSGVRKRVEMVSASGVEKLRAEFCDECEAAMARQGRMIYRNAALIVTAFRPAITVR